jgi:hypothetical protein
MRLSLEKKRLGPLTAVATILILAAAGCSLDEVAVPPVEGPSETGISVELNALPDTLNADGVSVSVIKLVLRKSDGTPASAMPIYFAHDGDGVISPASGSSFVGPVQTGLVMLTDSKGATSVVYTAGSFIGTVTVFVRPYNIDGANYFERTVEILQR